MVSLSALAVQQEAEWWTALAPYVAQEPRPELDRRPDLRVVDVTGLAVDRRLLWTAADLGWVYFLRARLCREMFDLNQQLASALRDYLGQ